MPCTDMGCSSAIAESFEKHCRHEERIQQKRIDKMPLKDLMMLWFDSIDKAGGHLDAEPTETVDAPESTASTMDEAEPEPDLPELDVYRQIINSNSAYNWLCGTLQRFMLTESDSSDALESVSSALQSCLPTSYTVSKRTGPVAHRVRYVIALDLLSFVKDQKYKESPADAILNAITITGNSAFTQATTFTKYLLQTWPSTAGHLIQALKGVLERGKGSSQASMLHLPCIFCSKQHDLWKPFLAICGGPNQGSLDYWSAPQLHYLNASGVLQ